MGDPVYTQGRILPIPYHKASLDKKEAISFPAPFRARCYLGFTSKEAAAVFYAELLGRLRGQPTPRGERHQPARFKAGPSHGLTLRPWRNSETDSCGWTMNRRCVALDLLCNPR